MTDTVQSYRQLIAWQKSMKFTADVYRATRNFPKWELYGLVSQLRRAAISVPSNVAEGQGRRSTGEFKHFLGIARGSLLETETQILLALELQYLSSEDSERLLAETAEVGRIINGLINSLDGKRRN